MEWVCPQDYADLFRIFERLEGGVSVGLLPSPAAPLSAGPETEDSGPWIGVCSSGSTGMPKRIWHSWAEFRKSGRLKADGPAVWASSFEPWSFAGAQLGLQAWLNRSEAVFLGTDWKAAWQTLRERGVDGISCTPTYLDLLLQNETSGPEWKPRQITLGGEAARPAVLSRAKKRFPEARFTLIYASAELGVLLKTNRTDGWHETASLSRRYPEWRVADGELEVRRGGVWFQTHDLAEVRGDLMRIAGRANDVANVGGVKVSLARVARQAEEVEGVRQAMAFAVPSAVAGEVAGLRLSVAPGCDAEEVRARVEAHLRQHLPKAAWPRYWETGEPEPGRNSKQKQNLSGQPPEASL